LAGLAAAEWTCSADLAFWNVPALKAEIAHEIGVVAELQSSDEQILQRITLKNGVVAALSAGRISLLQAAAQFRTLNAQNEVIAEVDRLIYPEISDDERVCRNVISYAESFCDKVKGLSFRLRLELLVRKAIGQLRIPVTDMDDELNRSIAATGTN
jgi:hypothetical protein